MAIGSSGSISAQTSALWMPAMPARSAFGSTSPPIPSSGVIDGMPSTWPAAPPVERCRRFLIYLRQEPLDDRDTEGARQTVHLERQLLHARAIILAVIEQVIHQREGRGLDRHRVQVNVIVGCLAHQLEIDAARR